MSRSGNITRSMGHANTDDRRGCGSVRNGEAQAQRLLLPDPVEARLTLLLIASGAKVELARVLGDTKPFIDISFGPHAVAEMIVKTFQIIWHDKLPVLSCAFHSSGAFVTSGADHEVKVCSCPPSRWNIGERLDHKAPVDVPRRKA